MFILLCLGTINLYAQVPELEPTSVVDNPYADLQVCDRVAMKANTDYEVLSDVEIALFSFVQDDPVLSHFYSYNCSWYCGGQIDSVTASSALADRYAAEKAHDFSIVTAWVEGVDGNGEG